MQCRPVKKNADTLLKSTSGDVTLDTVLPDLLKHTWPCLIIREQRFGHSDTHASEIMSSQVEFVSDYYPIDSAGPKTLSADTFSGRQDFTRR